VQSNYSIFLILHLASAPLIMASHAPEARASSEDDSDYEPTEDESQENIAQAYLEQLLSGDLDEDGEDEEGNREEEGGGG
jgi:WD repeat-containing protein 23